MKEAGMNFDNLSPEQLEDAKACKTPEEFLGFCEKNQIKLSKEELETVTGGAQECNIGYLCFVYGDCKGYIIPPEEVPEGGFSTTLHLES